MFFFFFYSLCGQHLVVECFVLPLLLHISLMAQREEIS